MPFVGNLPKQERALRTVDLQKKNPIEHHLFSPFGGHIPKVLMDFRGPTLILVVNDPHIMNELYVTKNKFFDKDAVTGEMFKSYTGESILFA